MGGLVRSLCFSSTTSFSLLEPPNLSSLPPTVCTPNNRSGFQPTSLFIRHTCRFRPIHCSSSTSTLTAENPSSEAKEEELSSTRLFAQNLPWTCTADDIRAMFQKHGTVVDVEVSMYSKTRNRGLAFVEMGSAEEAAQALANLKAFEYEGRKLQLNYAYPKKNKVSPPVPTKPPVLYNLFVANLSLKARAKDLREFFQSGGINVVSAQVIFNENPRRSAGYGFVSLKSKKEADEVLSTFQGKELMARPIRLARSRRFGKLESESNSQSEDGQDISTNSSDVSEQRETVDSS